jgi:choline dehydrogenase-like flavoprotein
VTDGFDPTALAALARMIPADQHPSVVDESLLDALAQRRDGFHKTLWERSIDPGCPLLDAEAVARQGTGFVGLAEDQQDAVLADVEAGRTEEDWGDFDPWRFVNALTKVANETFYGTRGSPAWAMVGFDPSPSRPARAPIEFARLTTTEFGAVRDDYDVVIVGAGAGGGIAAGVLAEAGLDVLVVERGESLSFDQVGRDHLANHRLSAHGHNTGPDRGGDPRVRFDQAGNDRVIDKPWEADWSNNAMTVGGGGRVYQGMAWRFLPQDFELASLYGVPEGSTLADWPITYAELEPFYTRAEWELGVCGDGSTHRAQGDRSQPYPMPPFALDPEGEALEAGAARLGISTGPVPLLINSEPRDGRAACVGCGECVGFACPSEAKNGSWNTLLVRALATNRCTLVTGTRTTQITTSGGSVDGVELLDWASGARRRVRASQVVVAAGAIESARLLLASRSDEHPEGLGNDTDQVGRNLQSHQYVGAFGEFEHEVISMDGPGVTIGTCDWNHDVEAGLIAGALHNEVIKLPELHRWWALPPGTPPWGLGAKDAMRRLYRRTGHLYGPIQEIPMAECRVTLADGVADKHGSPVARWGGRYHPDSLRAGARQAERAEGWLAASGALRTWSQPPYDTFMAGQHQAGTCRMGDDPATSVTDRWGRVHGHDNLWVMDGSVHVTNGGFNPVLTLSALAFRSAEHLAQQ